MYTSGPPPPMHMIPSPNFCAPPGYSNVPFPQQYAPYYPPACNYYCNHAPGPYSSPNSKANGPQMPSFNPAPQMPLFSQPPPGYGVNGTQMCQNSCTNNAAPSYQPVHMANVCSPSFNGFSAPSAVPANNFSRPPPSPQINGRQTNDSNRFSRHGNNRREFDAKSSPYYCETCDRGFPSLSLFTKHNSEHITCGAEGCTFSGHAKIVDKHFMMQHRSGLFNRIVKGYSPEEIKKWITDRKKHFPTKEKVEVKQAQKEEMQKRGERYAERKRKYNERNNHFRSAGPSNRFNQSAAAPKRNGRFPSKPFVNRRDSTRSYTKKEPPKITDEDCILRNIPPFNGTEFYLNVKTDTRNEEPEEHTLSDDDYSVFSVDDDVVIDNDSAVPKENVISELEKCCETSQPVENFEEDCLDKYFKNCDIEDENEKIDECDTTNECNTKSTNSKMKFTKSLDDSPVKHPITPEPPVTEKLVEKGVGSLALIQCYDSDGNDDTDSDTEQDDCKIATPKVIEIESKQADLLEDRKCDENSSKFVPVEKNVQSCSSPIKKPECDESDNSSDDSGPEECSSKSVPIETNNCISNPSLLNKIEPIPGSSKSSSEEPDKDSESKRRKRKRHKDGKDEVKGNEATEETSEETLPSVVRPRKRYRRPTLLEKLLGSEIKHERNVVLQCIRYVVQNDFFQKEKSDSL